MTEQRRHARLPFSRRIKVRCADTGRCYAGQTRDVAAGGLCVELDTPAAIAPGSHVQIAVDWSGKQTVIPAELMAPAVIVRRVGIAAAGRPRFGVRYDQAQPLAATA